MRLDKRSRIVFWKEVRDLSRDYRTIVSVVLLPLLGLPGLAILTGALLSAQYVEVAIIVNDTEAWSFAGSLAGDIALVLSRAGLQSNVETYGSWPEASVDVVVFIPEGFYRNITRIDGTGTIIVSSLIGSQASEIAVNNIIALLNGKSRALVVERVNALSERAGLDINADNLLNPIRVQKGFHRATGAPATGEEASVAFSARILEFSLFFVVNPAVVFMSDSIVGERERKTIERLLVSPLSRRQLLTGKMLASTVLGLMAAAADGMGILLFFLLAGISFALSTTIIGVWLASVILLVLSTSAIVSIIASRSESIRAAQNMSFLVILGAMAIYFSSLMVDLTKLPESISLFLQMIPFTHAALAIHYYALGDIVSVAKHFLIMTIYWLALLLIAAKTFNTEKLIITKS
ncbi:MAG: ABC transporter permease [Desulfurococcales archaeon]|nr:ABC transporter permease [Desulfurococcales archaeon]